MHPAVEHFVKIMTEDVKKWEKAAADVDALVQHMPEPDKEHWEKTAANYRENAERYKAIIKQYLEDNEPKAAEAGSKTK